MDIERKKEIKKYIISDIVSETVDEDDVQYEKTEEQLISDLSKMDIEPLKNIYLNRLLEFKDEFNLYATTIDYGKWSRDDLQRAEIDFIKYFDISKDEAKDLNLDAARRFAAGYWFDQKTEPIYTEEARLFEVSYYKNSDWHIAGYFTDFEQAAKLEEKLDSNRYVDFAAISDMSVKEALERLPVERPVERKQGRFEKFVERDREIDF